MTSAKAESRLAEFLRRVLAEDNDAAPADVVFGPSAAGEMQQSMARDFASSIRDQGYVEPVDGPDGDLRRVRVTAQGRDWLGEYDGRSPRLHPRYSS